MTEKQSRSSPLVSTCAGCGLVLPARGGPTHPHLGSSPECWALYGELLAREYGNREYFSVHQLSVDTYAVQHPGEPERRTIQSVALHLITLCLVLEQGLEPRQGPKVHERLAGNARFEWLEPPHRRGRLTVADPLAARSAAEHRQLVAAWAEDVWAAWRPPHETIRRWAERAFESTRV